jgi:hypothetical protein
MHGCCCLRALMALEKAPMWAVQVVRHVLPSYTFGDVQFEVVHAARCEQRLVNNVTSVPTLGRGFVE